ncbi:hypothetical protein WR25_06194 [Diploscapter pachys]|uniref:Acyltransferase 3 domain-containing protein n=1 Tax=Diploscapter pachys TaxID=2018661 RepID=A0A2A2LSJ1_9BILA|nr:hypothetical protein WR25_06194 [Diploscapter pachys]
MQTIHPTYSTNETKLVYFSFSQHWSWSVLARLTYNVYLLHMPIIFGFNHLPFLQTATSAFELMLVIPLVSICSFIAAFLFFIFFESPISRLVNYAIPSMA